MAVVHVTTWSDFKTAVAGTNNQVIIDNDIMCDEMISDSTMWNCESIDGQDHAIYNIQSTYNGSEFKAGRVITISNLKFLNFALYGVSYLRGMFQRGGTGKWFVFNDCKFQGMTLKGLFDDGCDCNRCSISLSSCRFLIADSPERQGAYNECWIDLGTVTCKNNDSVIIWGDLRNTYVKGTINLTNQKDDFVIIRGDVTSSVFNAYIKCDTSRAISLIRWNNSTNSTCLYNTDRIKTASESDLNHRGWTGLKDSELKSATAVQATGFPIVV